MHATLLPRKVKTHEAKPAKPEGRFYIVVFGVCLPVVAFLIEIFTHWSREIYFDPLGHPLHIACILLVPFANAFGVGVNAGRSPRWLFWVSNLNSAALVVGAVYALIYLPIVPFALFAIVIGGVGFLPLSPLMALIASVIIRKRLSRILLERDWRSGWMIHLGLLSVAAALLLPIVPRVLTWNAAICALEKTGTVRHWGVSWLRASADVDYLRDLARADRGRGISLFSWFKLSPSQAGQALFLATGKTIETHPGAVERERWRWDPDRGMQKVGAMIPEVSMELSAINSSVDAAAGVAYTEWTFAFTNTAAIQNEARMEVQLPRHGVVSRLTLWINGEPCEAAFGTRAQTTAAYQSVVRQQRDPVLVTTSGVDRVIVQCFPVPPNGGTMQARIGVSSPLALTLDGRGELVLPEIRHRNFTLDEAHRSSCWIESRAPMMAAGFTKWAAPEPGTFALRGEQPTMRLGEARLRSIEPVGESYYRASVADGGKLVLQKPESAPVWRPEKLAVVLDSSAGMESARDELVRALPKLARDCETTLLIVNDGGAAPLLSGPLSRLDRAEMDRCVAELEKVRFSGGKSSAGALLQAWEAVSSSPRGAILWLHGPEPAFEVPFALTNSLDRHPGSPKIFSLQVNPGPNHLVDQLSRFPALNQERWQLGALSDLLGKWALRREEKFLVRTTVAVAPPGARETSSHLMRIWAGEQVARQLKHGQTKVATTLALAQKIVTPVSGAVVLENRAQYEAAGLKPEDASRVPTIPEPSEALLLFVAIAFLLGQRWRSRSATAVI